MYPALEAAKAKWDRGLKDLTTLSKDVLRFTEGDPYRISVDFDAETGWHIAHMRMVDEPPPALSVLVGAVAYQGLSALNLIAWELATRKLGRHKVVQKRLERNIAFPIAKDSKDFQSLPLIQKRYVSKQAIAALDGVQPYNTRHGPGGPRQHSLFLIKELADLDKHRVLASALGQMDLSGIRFEWDEAVARNPTIRRHPARGRRRVIRDGAPLARIRFEVGNAEAKVRVDRQPTAQVAFLTNTWTIGVPALSQALVDVMLTIRALAPLFPRQPDPWASQAEPPPGGSSSPS